MATDKGTVAYISEQAAGAGSVSARAMFGEYALYCDGKVVALICDDQLFLKPTEAGRTILGPDPATGAAYPGAKPSYLIAGDLWDDADWMARVVRATADALPAPKPKKPKAKP
jgi:DNA transformation protein and related proteins